MEKMNVETPPDKPDTEMPPDHLDTKMPPDHPDREMPPDHPDTEMPPDHPDTEMPPGHPDTEMPPDHLNTETTQDHPDTETPPGHPDTEMPPDHLDIETPPDHYYMAPRTDEMANGDDVDKRKIPQKEDSTPSPNAGQVCRRTSLGIFCWNTTLDILPLMEDLLLIFGDGSMIPVSPDNESDWRLVEESSAVIIFCGSPALAPPEAALRRFLDRCFTKHGAENMTMVITDLDDVESERRIISEWTAGEYSRCPLLTLTAAEVDAISTSDRCDLSAVRRMARKVHQMRDIVRGGRGRSRDLLQRLQLQKPKTKEVMGIFSREVEAQYSWLTDTLRSEVFKDHIAEVRTCCISNNGFQQFSEDTAHCTFGILYHSKNRGRINVTNVNGSLYDEELEHLSCNLGKKVIVVIDDLSDSSEECKAEILKHQRSIRKMAEDLFLISQEEKTSNYQRRLMVDREALRRKLQNLEEKTKRKAGDDRRWPLVSEGWETLGTEKEMITEERENTSETALGGHPADVQKAEKSKKGENKKSIGPVSQGENNGTCQLVKERIISKRMPRIEFSLPAWSSKKCVGIFSRSSDSEYSWLKTLLETKDFSDQVLSVRSCYISNEFSKLYHHVSQCEFGILYHTKNRGRINVTNVVDSLYDEELEYLSFRLGKKNVVVVIDDLEDHSDAMKERLLRTQHSIENLAQHLILVKTSSPQEKMRATKDAFTNALH